MTGIDGHRTRNTPIYSYEVFLICHDLNSDYVITLRTVVVCISDISRAGEGAAPDDGHAAGEITVETKIPYRYIPLLRTTPVALQPAIPLQRRCFVRFRNEPEVNFQFPSTSL